MRLAKLLATALIVLVPLPLTAASAAQATHSYLPFSAMTALVSATPTAGSIATAICKTELCNHVVNYTDREYRTQIGYDTKAFFRDSRARSYMGPLWPGLCPDVGCGGSVEVFAKPAQAEARANYLYDPTYHAGWPYPYGEYDLVAGNVLLRVSGGLSPSVAASYEQAFHELTGEPVHVFGWRLPHAIYSDKGTQSGQTGRFTVSASAPYWQVNWSFHCSPAAGSTGGFDWAVYGPYGMDPNDFDSPNQDGNNGSGTIRYYDHGKFYLNIVAYPTCKWAIQVVV